MRNTINRVKKYLSEQRIASMIYYSLRQDQFRIYQGLYPLRPVIRFGFGGLKFWIYRWDQKLMGIN